MHHINKFKIYQKLFISFLLMYLMYLWSFNKSLLCFLFRSIGFEYEKKLKQWCEENKISYLGILCFVYSVCLVLMKYDTSFIILNLSYLAEISGHFTPADLKLCFFSCIVKITFKKKVSLKFSICQYLEVKTCSFSFSFFKI